MYNETITYYSKNPFNKFEMENPTISHFESNDLCGDDLTIYLKISNNIIENWSFTGDTAIITTACTGVFGESIIGMNVSEILKYDYNYIVELIENEVSDRRKKASVLGLLTTRNAIHKYLKDGKVDDFDDVIS
ncbi:MAG: iron-sulfur cluster assembly scaffold protein [Candidatus Gracilibacteria bacterium]|nr:iron-sulfur cluster assembly scaffold protein [Candidatus Gracilibacteria bacterium]